MPGSPPMPTPSTTPTRSAIPSLTLGRRRDGVEDEEVHAVPLAPVHPVLGTKAAHLARDPARKALAGEAGDRADPRAPRPHGLPVRGHADAERRHHAEAGDDDAAAHAAPRLQRRIAAPPGRPAPAAVRPIRSPGTRWPAVSASASAIGIEAAPVLP